LILKNENEASWGAIWGYYGPFETLEMKTRLNAVLHAYDINLSDSEMKPSS
jgi:hypothetical protein